MINLGRILKSRDITLLTKVCLVKAMAFPVVMYGYESWTIKKAERQRTDAFKLWCWRRLMRVPVQQGDQMEKTLMFGKTEGKRRRGRQNEMVGWHQ